MLTKLFWTKSAIFSRRNLSSPILSQSALAQLKHQQSNPMLLPVGYESFSEVSQKKKLSFVDKSLFIQDVLDDESAKTVVITRPRCFGKSFNLSMLHCFLANEVDGQSTADLFNNLKIASLGEEYMQHQGKYPVVLINFKDVGQPNFKETYSKLYELMVNVYRQHAYLAKSHQLTGHQKKLYKILMEGKANQEQLKNSLKVLMECLLSHHKVKPWLLVDEYDTPLQMGYVNHYYDEILDVTRGLLAPALMSNSALEKSVMMGIFQIAKENLFSGINHLAVYSLLSHEYSEHFGFTETEVNEIVEKSNLKERSELIKSWYSGHRFENTLMHNPLSVASVIKHNGKIATYWANGGDNQLIKDLLTQSSTSFKKDFILLLRGESVEKFINQDMQFQYLNHNLSSIWTLLLMGGYLKQVSYRETDQGTFAKLAIPNKEILNLYRQMIEQWLSKDYGIQWYNEFINSLLSGNTRVCKRYWNEIISHIVGTKNSGKDPDEFYHGLLLGLNASLHSTGTHEIKFHQETKEGDFEILIMPKHGDASGIIILLRAPNSSETIVRAGEDALQKINEKRLIEEMKSYGIQQVIKIGIGFRNNCLSISSAKDSLENHDTSVLKCS